MRSRMPQTRPFSHNAKASTSKRLRHPTSFVTLLIFLVVFHNTVIFNVYRTYTKKYVARFSMESMMDAPRTTPSRTAKNSDVIVYLTQFSNVHSSYGAQTDAASQNITGVSKFQKSLDLLYTNYLNQFPTCDVLIFYESTSPPSNEIQTQLRENRPQLKFRELNGSWWELPYDLDAAHLHKWKRPKYSIGYRHMMRWFAVLIWPYLTQEGYTHVMRLDDDSYIHSRIHYNLFEYMRENGKKYAFRQPVRDSGVGKGYDKVVDDYLLKHSNATTQELIHTYKNVSKRVGFYNNFFMADLSFFTSELVAGLLRAIDESKLIYEERTGDLVIHSTAVRLFLHPDEIHWFRDFTYEHMTLCRMEICGKGRRTNYKGCPVNGGVSRGFGVYSDEEWEAYASIIKNQFHPQCNVEIDWNFIGADDSVRECDVTKKKNCWDYLQTLSGANDGTVEK